MFDFINENVPEEEKTIFVINRSVQSYETRSSLVLHIPKVKTSCLSLNTLRYDGANIWDKLYHETKEINLTKAKFKCGLSAQMT